MIHVAITRTVRPGREAEFEARLKSFFEAAQLQAPATQALLLRPARDGDRELGILRTFPDEATRDAFYASELYEKWNADVAELVEGEPDKRELHGLEAFFRTSSAEGPPAAWKMAILTWIAVNPAVYIYANGVPAAIPGLPMLAELFLVNAFVVATLTWVFMPLLVKVFAGWIAK